MLAPIHHDCSSAAGFRAQRSSSCPAPPVTPRPRRHLHAQPHSELQQPQQQPTSGRLAQPARSQSIRVVDSPNAGWQAPQNQPAPHDADDLHTVDPAAAETNNAALYTLLISAVVPRPVGFVATVDREGRPNLAPFTFFNLVSNSPPVIALGIGRSTSRGVDASGKPRYKDTMQNIVDTREFTCSIISEWFVESANHCGGEFDAGTSEFEASGLTPVPSVAVKAPRVRESAVQLECRVRHIEELTDKDGNLTTSVVLADIVMIHVAKAVAGKSPTGKLVVDFAKLRPVARLAGYQYGRVSEVYEIPGPDKNGKYAPRKTG